MIVVGAVTDKVVARDGQPVVRQILPLTMTLDHRFVDGYQAATMARVFREYMEDPAAFDPVPTVSRDHGGLRSSTPANGKVSATAATHRP